ncbi:diguanylate cyclase [Pseudodesulfovibrio senegalensis]|uniref:Diguanylate cyclase n=2 Tax=Pseudodesulfovibrio senegalensis TaxID=1721087 RepID=A0A6N6N1G8_9BACT|nr:diguanylate cyclase [Pseudodesulfovibrio senegalensis]
MRTKQDAFVDGCMTLTRQQLIDCEHALKDALAGFLSFSSYSLFFPRTDEDPQEAGARAQPEYRREDRELLLPLVLRGRLLGYFVARGVKLAAPKVGPTYIMALATAVLERMALERRVIIDPLTSLYNRDFFLSELTRSIEQVQDCLHTGTCSAKPLDMPTFSGTFGVIFVDLDRFRRVCERYGYLVGDDMVAEVGRLLDLVCPHHVSAARFGNDKFAILLPDAKPKACFQLAEVIREGIDKLSFVDDVTGDTIRFSASVGYANYPQALDGPQFRKSPAEQARVLLRRARRAVSTAKDLGRNRVFAYADILEKGGKVLEMLPMERMAVSLGGNVRARVGQRFLVSSPRSRQLATAAITEDEHLSGRYPTLYKGEAVLIEVQEEMAFAELLHAGDPAFPVSAGDRLRLVAEHESIFEPRTETDDMSRKEPATGLYAYRDFISRFETARQSESRFGLALVRLLDEPGEHPGTYQDFMDSMARSIREQGMEIFGENAMAGRYGLGGVIFHVPDVDGPGLRAAASALEKLASEHLDITVAIGGAVYPYLNFRRTDMLDNSRKALDHASLLPEPCVAVFDSVSMNLVADRLFTDGDIYGAVEEYKLALLADAGNLLARNSLGICYAQLGKLAEARQEFSAVLEIDPTDAMALYNLGWANHRLGRLDKAREAYELCLKQDSEHVFSMIRLGNLAERDKDLKQALRWYSGAQDLPGGERLVLRSMARVHRALGDHEQCRECLHLALNANHNDDQAMHMLAGLYLETGEDPQIAEVLARQSAALNPARDEYWETLVRALLEQGKDEEARKVRGRAAG